jgi:hypothetical protein
MVQMVFHSPSLSFVQSIVPEVGELLADDLVSNLSNTNC